MHTTSSYFSLPCENVTFEIETRVCLPSIFLKTRVYLTWCVTMSSSGNSGNQRIETFAAESNGKLNETA